MPAIELKEQPWRLLGDSLITQNTPNFDQSRFTNDGDCPLWIEKVGLFTESGVTGLNVRPSNGPPWSRDPVLPVMLGNGQVSTSFAVSSLWQLAHPYPLNPHDSIQIVGNAALGVAGNAINTVTMWGRKELGAKTTPPVFKAPRVFTDAVTTTANGDVRKFDTEKFRNWGGEPVELHWLKIIGYVNTAVVYAQDPFRLRVRMGTHTIIGKNTMTPYTAVAPLHGWKVPLYGMRMDPGVALEIEVERNFAGGGTRNLVATVYGSAEVRASHV